MGEAWPYWLLIAAINLVTAILAFKTHGVAVTTQVDMRKVELATNSMKDALVAATGKAAHAAGLEEGRTEGIIAAATLAQGVLAGSKEAKS